MYNRIKNELQRTIIMVSHFIWSGHTANTLKSQLWLKSSVGRYNHAPWHIIRPTHIFYSSKFQIPKHLIPNYNFFKTFLLALHTEAFRTKLDEIHVFVLPSSRLYRRASEQSLLTETKSKFCLPQLPVRKVSVSLGYVVETHFVKRFHCNCSTAKIFCKNYRWTAPRPV